MHQRATLPGANGHYWPLTLVVLLVVSGWLVCVDGGCWSVIIACDQTGGLVSSRMLMQAHLVVPYGGSKCAEQPEE